MPAVEEEKKPILEREMSDSVESKSDGAEVVDALVRGSESRVEDMERMVMGIKEDSPEATQARSALVDMVEESRKAVEIFKTRAAEIVGLPLEFYDKRKKAAWERRLRIPDDEKVIADMYNQVKAIDRKLLAYEEQRSRKLNYGKLNAIDDVELLNTLGGKAFEGDGEIPTALKTVARELQGALKISRYINTWEYVGDWINRLVMQAIEAAISKNNIEECLQWWQLLPPEKVLGYHSGRESFNEKLVQKIINSKASGRRAFTNMASTEDEFDKRVREQSSYQAEVKTLLEPYPELAKIFTSQANAWRGRAYHLSDTLSETDRKIKTMLDELPADSKKRFFFLPEDLRSLIARKFDRYMQFGPSPLPPVFNEFLKGGLSIEAMMLWYGFNRRNETHVEKRNDYYKNEEVYFEKVSNLNNNVYFAMRQVLDFKNEFLLPDYQTNLEIISAAANLTDLEKKSLEAVQAGLINSDRDIYDSDIIEGQYISTAVKLESLKSTEDWKKINSLSDEQKKLFVKLRSLGEDVVKFNISSVDQWMVELESGNANKVLDLVDKGFKGEYNVLKGMARHSDCLGLFYYIGDRFCDHDPVITNALYFLTQKKDDLSDYFLERFQVEKCLSMLELGQLCVVNDDNSMAKINNDLSERGLHLDLKQILRIYFLRTRLGNVEDCLPILGYFDDPRVSIEDISGYPRRLKRLEAIDKIQTPIDKTVFHAVLEMSEDEWGEVSKDEETLTKAIGKIKVKPRNSEMEKVLKEKAREFASRQECRERILHALENWDEIERKNLSDLLPFLCTQLLQDLAAPYWDEKQSLLKIRELCHELSTKDVSVLGQISGKIGLKFDINVLKDPFFIDRVKSCESADEIIAKMDDVDAHSIASSVETHWGLGRKSGLLEALRDRAPLFGKVKSLFLDSDIIENTSLYLVKELSEMSQYALDNYSKMVEAKLSIHCRFNGQNLKILLESENFDAVFGLLVKRKDALGELIIASESQLGNFLELADAAKIDNFLSLPNFIQMKAIDLTDYFSEPSFRDRLYFAEEARKILGSSFKVEAAELFYIDPVKDLEYLKELNKKCVLPVTGELLTILAHVRKVEEMGGALWRLSALADKNGSIKQCVFQLEKSNKRLALAIMEDTVRKTGWEVMLHQEEILKNFNFTEAEWKQVVGSMLKHLPSETMVGVGFENLRLILECLSEQSNTYKNSKRQLIYSLINKFNEPARMEEMWHLLIDGDYLSHLELSHLPSEARRSKIVWNLLLEKKPELVAENFDYVLNNIYTKEDMDSFSADKRTVFIKKIDTVICGAFKDGNFSWMMMIKKIVDKFEFEMPSSNGLFEIIPYVADDPIIRSLLTDSSKLGSIREILLKKISQFCAELFTSKDPRAQEKVKIFLYNLRRTYLSSESTLIEKRTLFLDKYEVGRQAKRFIGQDACGSHAFQAKIGDGRSVKDIMAEDFEDILIKSGNEEMKQHYRRSLQAAGEQDEALFAELKEKITQIEAVRKMADSRNREIQVKLARAADAREFSEIAVPNYTSVSQVGPSNVTQPILKYGTLCDGLLGAGASDEEENLASHIVWTKKLPPGETLRSRLVAYGNPHGTSVFRIYGDISKLKNQPYGLNGSTDHPLYEGVGHYCIEAGIPSTEITAVVLSDIGDAPEQKKAIATTGFFIPLIDLNTEKLLWTAEEFGEMKIFYNSLDVLGYSQKIIDQVFDYYGQNKGADSKHGEVLRKAFVFAAGGGDLDWATLVDFLKNNDLNTRSLQWYRDSNFEEILKIIKKGYGAKSRQKVRDRLFVGADSRTPLGNEPAVERQKHAFIDDYFDVQLSYLEADEVQRRSAEQSFAKLLFSNKPERDAPEVAEQISEQKKSIMRKVWTEAWDSLEQSGEYKKFKKYLVPIIAGGIGRGEAVLGSDLDYNIFVDDSALDGEPENLMESLKEFVNKVLADKINKILGTKKIRADAGLAKEDRVPFVKLSSVRDLQLNMQKARQAEEPTEIIDAVEIFGQDKNVVQKFKNALYSDTRRVVDMESFLIRDIEMGDGKKASFISKFEEISEALASGNMLQDVKQSLQRVIDFKLYHFAFGMHNAGKLKVGDLEDVPASTFGKIKFFEKKHILTREEADNIRDLLALTYKIRFVGEFYSHESENVQELKKVKNVTFRLDEFSYEERERLVKAMKYFKDNMLYK